MIFTCNHSIMNKTIISLVLICCTPLIESLIGMRFVDLKAVIMYILFLLALKPCSLVSGYQHFGGTCYLNEWLHLEAGVSKFLRILGTHLQDHKTMIFWKMNKNILTKCNKNNLIIMIYTIYLINVR
jgi:hypothetical protein